METIELVIKYTNVQIDVYEIKYLLIKKENALYGTTNYLCVSTVPSSFLCKNS